MGHLARHRDRHVSHPDALPRHRSAWADARERRILHSDWDLYDTRHAVFQPKCLTREQLETGYWHAYKDFYRWGSIVRGAAAKVTWSGRLRHIAYAAGWKKFEPLWHFIIRMRQV